MFSSSLTCVNLVCETVSELSNLSSITLQAALVRYVILQNFYYFSAQEFIYNLLELAPECIFIVPVDKQFIFIETKIKP